MTDTTPHLRLQTDRLELIAATADVIDAELNNPIELESLVSARLADGWPPPELDERVLRLFLHYLSADTANVGWRAWYYVLKTGPERVLVGNGGFKGPPDHDGMVELGYSVMPAYQRRGICTEAVRSLISWAFKHPEVRSVRAETDSDNAASLRVMEKSGLRHTGPGTGEDEVRYAITREEFRLL
jgi:[ribosomal protein S5]-alanine N-acetyltransferase